MLPHHGPAALSAPAVHVAAAVAVVLAAQVALAGAEGGASVEKGLVATVPPPLKVAWLAGARQVTARAHTRRRTQTVTRVHPHARTRAPALARMHARTHARTHAAVHSPFQHALTHKCTGECIPTHKHVSGQAPLPNTHTALRSTPRSIAHAPPFRVANNGWGDLRSIYTCVHAYSMCVRTRAQREGMAGGTSGGGQSRTSQGMLQL